MTGRLIAFLLAAATTPVAAQFGTAAAANPPADPPKRGADIKPPKVRRHYSRAQNITGWTVVALVETGFNGDVYVVTCGYAFYGKTPPDQAPESLLVTVSHSEPFGSEPDDPLPSLTIEADTLHAVIRQVVSTSFGSFLEYDHQLHYRVPLGQFRVAFDADSVDLRVRKHVYRIRGRGIESCRWFGDRAAENRLRP
jgi:hypothetical protein